MELARAQEAAAFLVVLLLASTLRRDVTFFILDLALVFVKFSADVFGRLLNFVT